MSTSLISIRFFTWSRFRIDLVLVEVQNIAKIDTTTTERSAALKADIDDAVSLSIGKIGVYRPTLIQ